MRRMTFLFISFLIFVVLLAFTAMVDVPVKADSLLQDVPRLDGMQIYFTEENGEASRFDRSEAGASRFAGLLRDLGAELKTLEWRTGIPADADLIIMTGPVSDISSDQVARLWSYLSDGGRLLLLAEPVSGTGRSARGFPAGSSLFGLMWSDMGLRARNDFVALESVVEATTQNGTPQPPRLTLQLDFITDIVNTNASITEGISGEIAFYGARSLEIDASDRAVEVTPLIFSPELFYGETGYNDFLSTGAVAYNIGEDTTRGALLLGVAVSDPATKAQIVLIGDREFATNGGGLRSSPPNTGAFLNPDNPRLLLKSVVWLLGLDPAGLSDMPFPTPGATATATLTPTPVINTADLGLTITVNDVTPNEGEAIILNLVLVNNGPDTATNIFVSFPMPQGLTFVLDAASTRRGYTADTGEWEVGNLDAGDDATLFLVVTVDSLTAGKTLSGAARVARMDAVDPNNGNDVASIDVEVNTLTSLLVRPSVS